MSNFVDRAAYDIGAGDIICMPGGFVAEVIYTEANAEVEGNVLIHHELGTYECALTDTVAVLDA